MQTKVSAIILAAGQSTRLRNGNKLLFELNKRPLINIVLEAINNTLIKEIIVVVGYEQDKIITALDGYNVKFVENPEYKNGISTSIRTGLGAIKDVPDAVLVCLGDMPLVTTDTINTLISEFDPDNGQEICVPVYQGKRGNPVLWSNRFIHEMMLLQGDKGARKLFTRYSNVVKEVVVKNPGVVQDFDTIESFNNENLV